MNERRPLSIGFHPTGLLAISLLSLAIATCDIGFLNGSWRAYGLAAMWVLPWHVFQLFLDYRHSEQWYSAMTSSPYRLQPRDALVFRWPVLVSLIPAPFLGVIPVCVVSLVCLSLYYPWQRSLYIRSHREFGSSSNTRNS